MPKDTNITIHLKIHNNFPNLPPRQALHVQSRSYWAPANIGPYSQAISIPTITSSDPDTTIWTVDVAGQIPLIPSSMTLPARRISSEPAESHLFEREDFKLQTTLSLQHLWRIGREMAVSWWASAVVYLPRDTPEKTKDRSQIAAQAWSLIHAQNMDEDTDEDEERDLWEEKYYAGMEIRGEKKIENELPDWGILQFGVGPVKMSAPPFWAVEVEELPRGSWVEWHAHLGVVGGPVKVSSSSNMWVIVTDFEQLDTWGEEGSWTVSQCKFGSRMQVVVMIFYSKNTSQLSLWLRDASDSLGGEAVAREKIYLSYLDDSVKGVDETNKFAGTIQCRSIWDGTGCRLSAVLLIDSSL
jgi:diphthine-ammonia ligase